MLGHCQPRHRDPTLKGVQGMQEQCDLGCRPETEEVCGQDRRSDTVGQWQGGDSMEKRDQASSHLSLGVHHCEPPHNGHTDMGEVKQS